MLSVLATTNAASPGLLQALGIDWKLLVEQGVGFLILVAILGKFVYPALVKAIDDRRATIEAGLEEAKESQAALEKAEARVAEMLAEARKDADDILARTQQESASMIADAESKAKARAEQIVADAHATLSVEVTKARAALKKDTIELVALATERIIGEKLDASKDADLVKKALAREKV